MNKAIILFVRHPELGKVKTRLAREIGDDGALLIYKQLLQHTHDITCDLPYKKFVFYTDTVISTDIWEQEKYVKQAQTGNDLGERMRNAFVAVFESGYKEVVIIGSDCPGISAQIIDTAFERLNSFSVAIGPAADGGYYLLGLTYIIDELFKNKKWSTDAVLEDTLNDLSKKQIPFSLLPVLQDIDTKEDLVQLKMFLI
jgi:hypothetical protein